jgi:hypothetical protein
MILSLPPIPAHLWPKVIPVTGQRPPGRMLTLEIPGLSERPLLSALSRAIHQEMRAAGEWAARIDPTAKKEFPSEREFSRHRAEEAARLLAIYTALHGSAQYVSSFDLTPDALKAAASRSYQLGLRDVREQESKQDNPALPPLSHPLNPNLS